MNNYYSCSVSKENNANDNIVQMLIHAEEDKKVYQLHEILQKIDGSCLIFLETKRGVDSLSNFLNRANYNTLSIHGDKQQNQRLVRIFYIKLGCNSKIFKRRSSYSNCYRCCK